MSFQQFCEETLRESMFDDFHSQNPEKVKELEKKHGPVSTWSQSLKFKVLGDHHGTNKEPTDKDSGEYETAWKKGAYFK